MRGSTGKLILLVATVAATGAAEEGRRASGLRPGEEVSAWEPMHVAGPHAGTKTCPVCTYLEAPVLLAFARDMAAAEPLAAPLEEIARANGKGKLKVMLVVLDGTEDQLGRFAKLHAIRSTMFCRIDPSRRAQQLAAYKVDPAVTNTVMLYRDYLVTKSWAAMTAANLGELKKATEPYRPRP